MIKAGNVEKSSRELAKDWPFKRYKVFENELRHVAANWFSEKGLPTNARMGYCLKSHDSWTKNIICGEVADYITKRQKELEGKESYPLHKYAHHGLSSQAMVFNLVGPLIVKKDLEPLREVIEEAGMNWPAGEIEAQFEYDDRDVFNEDTGQPTSIDLFIKGNSERIFIEAKLAEKEFGGCSIFSGGDCDGRNPISSDYKDCYLHHIGRRYWELMDKFGFREMVSESGSICLFVNYYQFFREVLFSLEKKGCFLLLHDERNPAFWKVSKKGEEFGLWPLLKEFVPDKYKASIGRVTIQQLVRAIEKSGRHEWINEFKLKYGIV